ncbi:hypothetical protein Pcinc_023411 [Petrolisthes cinctipes]|uniref:OTU domain-containing protein 3 n=1 Tax=Petrolisthes cinctipes TaxID=88211 RepID=A0AAE1FCK6_PETCI|nr:hypothetical protein Pcinc_024467 [Petrolisthes cinctipes]KAK3871423.1 hypothetical protein Pcinc_023411 [Petrolisthes cinctipes]
MARKREERAIRNAQRAARKAANAGQGGTQDPNFVSLKQQLVAMGLTLREIPGDGNCLFRALGDQLDGTPNTHQKHRQDVVAYMRQHRNDFEPFVEDDVPFERHLSNLAELGTYAGNDCIVAFARLHKVVVVIHQLNAPLWQISGPDAKKSGMPELHISYHNGDHYNSVRRIGDCTTSPASIKLAVQESPPGTSAAAKDKKKKKNMGAGAEDGHWEEDGEYGCWAADDCVVEDYWTVEEGQLEGDCCEPVYEAPSKTEHMVMEQTGCYDLHLIRKHLEAHDYDVHQATEAIINFIILQHRGEHPQTLPGSSNGSLWGPSGTGTRLFGDSAATPPHPHPQPAIHPSYQKKTSQEKIQQRLRAQQHLSNTKRKELKKQLRKQQAQERKRQQQHSGQEPDEFTSSDDSEVIIVKDIGCLSI